MRLAAGRSLLILLFVLLGIPASATAQELYLDSTVLSGGGENTVGSIGVVTAGSDPAAIQQLLSKPLPQLAAHPALIPARDLRQKLAPVIGQGFVLVGGPIIYLPSTVVSSADRHFYTALLQSIEKKLSNQSLRVSVWAEKGQGPAPHTVQGNLEFQFPAGDNTPQALAANTFVQYRSAGRSTSTTLPINLKIEALVPVATEDLSYGSTFGPSAVSYKTEDVTKLSGTPADLTGRRYTAQSAISKGDVIYQYMASKVVAITPGKQIRISFRKGAIEVNVPGSAYQAGALGDTISVGPLANNARYHGTVVSPTEVVVND